MRSALFCLALLVVGVEAAAQQPDGTQLSAAMPQSQEFVAYLVETNRLGEGAVGVLGDPGKSLASENYIGPEDGVEGGTLGLSLNFIDATGGEFDLASVARRVVTELEAIYSAFPANRYGLEAVTFCYRTVRAPAPFNYEAGRERAWGADFPYATAFDFEQWSAYVESVNQDDGTFDSESIPIIVVEGHGDLLGFTAGLTIDESRPSPIVIEANLLAGNIEGRASGKVIAHLIANYLGLRPLWYPAELGGDLVEDTPQHNAPNIGRSDGSIHLSLVPGLPVELVDNVMDNTDDTQGANWTQAQAEFIRRCLARADMVIEVSAEKGCRDGYHNVEEENEDAIALRLVPPAESGVSLHVAPNPATDVVEILVELSVNSSSGKSSEQFSRSFTLQIVDANGRLARVSAIEAAVGGRTSRLEQLDDLPSGLYRVLLLHGVSKAQVATATFVRQ